MSEPADKPDKKLIADALSVKRGERTYAELDEKRRGEVRQFLRDTTGAKLRAYADAGREERRSQPRMGNSPIGRVRAC